MASAAAEPQQLPPRAPPAHALERARERDACTFYPLSLDIPDLSFALHASSHRLPPLDYRPRPSSDSVITAIAQLAVLRLRSARALISLISGHSQIILAEATAALPLRRHVDGQPDPGDDALWLGSVIIPRRCGVCEIVLDAGRDSVAVINDLQQDARFAACSFVRDAPHLRFYAGVPLVAATGSIIGSLCVFDDQPRDGLDPAEVKLLQDIGATAMSYLDAVRAKENNIRSERMIRGLTSFVTGAAELQRQTDLEVPRSPVIPTTASPLPSVTKVPFLGDPIVATTRMTEHPSPALDIGESAPSSQPSEEQPPQSPPRMDELVTLQDMILPAGAKPMFSRAANIMRESSDLSGVIIFDASVANPGASKETPPGSPAGHSETDWSVMEDHESGELEDNDATTASPAAFCKILGFADTERSSSAGSAPRRDYLTLTESDLKRLLTPSASAPSPSKQEAGTRSRRTQSRKPKSSALLAIMDIAQGVRSAALIPLWDFQRERWFAGCLCWTTNPKRALSHGNDLLFLRTFGNSIMTELSRLDGLAIDKAKSTFIESISHELRSPLHGILGGVEYLQGTQMDSFQTNIVGSIGMCGRTLLDTVKNMLEYSKINEVVRHAAQNTSLPEPERRGSSPSPPIPTVDLRALTEETVEAVFSGHSYNILSTRSEESEDPFLHPAPKDTLVSPRPSTIRKPVRVILDIPNHRSWLVAMHPAIWRRILMNVFGNALKYTEVGFIRVGLSAQDLSDAELKVTLNVSDSGVGMSSSYLQEGLFKPFSQENPFAAGTGLGLSIVRRLVESLGGNIQVQSKVKEGTEVEIIATVARRTSCGKDFVAAIAERVKGKRIFIPTELDLGFPGPQDCAERSEKSFISSVAKMLRELFEVDVETTSDTDSDSDQLVIYPGPSLAYMSRQNSNGGMSVVIALDAIEAATLKADERVVEGWIEIITQPCGPSKLGRILECYLKRLDRKSLTLRTSPRCVPDAPLSIHIPSTKAESMPPSDASAPKETSLSAKTTLSPVIEVETLPRPPSRPASSQKPLPSLSPSGQQKRNEVLIVDDNAINIRLLSAFLKKNGFPNHTSVQNGLEALNLFKEDPQRWAAVLMDLSMPVMDGITATSEIRAFERRSTESAAEVQVEERLDTGLEKGEGQEDPATRGTDDPAECGMVAGAATSEEGEKGSSEQRVVASTSGTGEASSSVQIIVITGLGSATARFAATTAGADAFMTKPIQFAELIRMLKEKIKDTAAAAPETLFASKDESARIEEGRSADTGVSPKTE